MQAGTDRRTAVLTLREDAERRVRNSVNRRIGVLAEAVIDVYDRFEQAQGETNQRLGRIESRLDEVTSGLAELSREVKVGLGNLSKDVRVVIARTEYLAGLVAQDEVKGKTPPRKRR